MAALERWIGDDAEHSAAECIRSNFPAGDPFVKPDTDGPPEKIPSRPASALPAYDCTAREIRDSIVSCRPKNPASNHFVWFIPEFDLATSEKVLTALRIADYFQRCCQIRSTFVAPGRAYPSTLRERIAKVAPGLAACDIEVVRNGMAVSNIAESDAAIAVSWDSAYRLLRYNKTGQKFYFFDRGESGEPAQPLVEATWQFGLKGLCVSPELRDLYVARGGDAQLFTPCIDRDVFYSSSKQPEGGEPYTLFCRTEGSVLHEQTLEIIKGHLGSRLRIITNEFGYRTSGAVFRMCDAALLLTGSRHSHDLALKLMACGSLVIAEDGPGFDWLLRNGDNCLLAPSTPSVLAATIEEGLTNLELRRRIVKSAAQMVHDRYSDWDRSAEEILGFILGITAARPTLEDQHPK